MASEFTRADKLLKPTGMMVMHYRLFKIDIELPSIGNLSRSNLYQFE